MSEEYTYLFNQITTAIAQLQELQVSLMCAQREAESLFLERTD